MISCDCDFGDYDEVWDGGEDYSTAPANCQCWSCGKDIKKGEIVRVFVMYCYIDDDDQMTCLQDPDDEFTKELAEKKTPYRFEHDGEEFYVIWGHTMDFDGYYYECDVKKYYCEECADLSFSLESLGYCYSLNFPLRRQWEEYLEYREAW